MLLALTGACQEAISSSGRLAHLRSAYQCLQHASLSTSAALSGSAPQYQQPAHSTGHDNTTSGEPSMTKVSDEAVPPAALQPFLGQSVVSNDVKVLNGLPAPTALSWLRRRVLPDVPASSLYKAFRQRQVRMYDGDRVRRVPEHRTLETGQRLLFPRHLMDLQQEVRERKEQERLTRRSSAPGSSSQGLIRPATPQHHGAGGDQTDQEQEEGASKGREESSQEIGLAPSSPYQLMAGAPPGLVNPEQFTEHMLRRRVLEMTRHAVFIDKPAGLQVQGPGPSLDDLIQGGLGFGRERLRLVHRLDRNVSGAMALARSQDAATWLAACFQEKMGAQDGSVDEEDLEAGMGVRRVYWALVAGPVPGAREGRIRSPVLVEGRFRPAVTDFKVRYSSPEGVSLLELWPQTGRKHQLRIHCARVLRAPILGDTKYGYQGVEPGKKLGKLLPAAWWHAFSPGTAERALRTVSVKQRRQMAARQALGDRRAPSDPDHPAGNEEHTVAAGGQVHSTEKAPGYAQLLGGPAVDKSTGSAAQDARGMQEVDMPLFLHSRRMVLKLPGQAPVRVKAPLPEYMSDLMRALNWQVPADS